MTNASAAEILSLAPGDIPDHLIWIDDGHVPESIIEAWSDCIDPQDTLTWQRVGDSLSITFNARVTPIPLQGDRGDVYVTINGLNEAMKESYGIYLYSPSADQSAHAFLVVPTCALGGFGHDQKKALDKFFEPIQPGKDYFSQALVGWPDDDVPESELEKIHDELFAGLSPESRTGNPHPLDALDRVPQSERLQGAKKVALFFLVAVGLSVLAAFLL